MLASNDCTILIKKQSNLQCASNSHLYRLFQQFGWSIEPYTQDAVLAHMKAPFWVMDEEGLHLYSNDFKVRLDWSSKAFCDKLRVGSSMPLVKACTLPQKRKSGAVDQKMRVLDVTAGLCSDAAILSANGMEVTACECSSVLFTLSFDALHRVTCSAFQPLLRERLHLISSHLHLIHGNAFDLLQKGMVWDVVYADPLFELTHSSALPKKQAQVFRRFGHDLYIGDILDSLQRAAKYRVVVKRGKRCAVYGKPMYSLQAKQICFDVYAGLAS